VADATHPADERHEACDVDRRRLLLFGAAFLGFLALSLGLLWLVFVAGAGAGGFAAARPGGPDPQGLLGQRQALLRYEADQRAALNAAGWLDDAHEHARLPIWDAMALLARRGLTLSAAPDGGDCPTVSEASPRAAAVTGCGAAP
jgi:hypothetical protein